MTRFRLVLLCLPVVLVGPAAIAADESLRAREEKAMQAALARVAPSVVRIETVGGLERIGRMLVGTGSTTGLIVSADGHIISSAYNFVQKPSSILVTLPDGSRAAARLVASPAPPPADPWVPSLGARWARARFLHSRS